MLDANRIPRDVCATALALFLSSAALHAQTPPRYRAEFLGDAINASDMNQVGVVVGSMNIGPDMRGWIAWHGHALAPLPLPAGRISSWANEINDQGVIVGAVSSYSSPQFFGVAAVWTPNGSGGYTIQELGILPGDISSNATALNNVGDIVGWSNGGTFRLPVLFHPGGAPQSLASTGVFDPQSINDSRVLVDKSADCKLLDLNTMQVVSLGHPPGSYNSVWAYSINASGQVAGNAIRSSGSCLQEAARYTNGVGWEIFSPCGSTNAAYDMNDQGDLIMRWNLAPYVLFSGLGIFLVEDLIDAPVGHWSVINGYGIAIDNARQLVVPAQNSTTGAAGLVLLTPDTPVGTPLCFGDGNWGACPCANDSLQGANEGCLTSEGIGARLASAGSGLVAADDLVLQLSQVPAGHTVVFLQGGSFTTLPFHDGLRCAGSPLVRLETGTASVSGLCFSTLSIVTRGAVVPGMSCVYQGWFRDNSGPCASGSNSSSGVQLTWQ